MINRCNLCNGIMEHIYFLNGYDIHQCKNCKTCSVYNMPTDKYLKKFYDGFNYAIDEDNKSRILNNNFRNWYNSFNLPSNAKMLDIGGGGVFFTCI